MGQRHVWMYWSVSDDGSGTAMLYAPLRAVLPSVNFTMRIPSTSNTAFVFSRSMSLARPAVSHATSSAALSTSDVHSVRACWMCSDVAGYACLGSSIFARIWAPLRDVFQITELANCTLGAL